MKRSNRTFVNLLAFPALLGIVGCAHKPAKAPPRASTVALDSRLGNARESTAKAQGSVAKARRISDRIEAKSVIILEWFGK